MFGSLGHSGQGPLRRLLLAGLLAVAGCATLAAHDVTPPTGVDVFLQPGPAQLVVKVWLPMPALTDANLPWTEDGRLDQEQIRPALDLVARGVARDLDLRHSGEPLSPSAVATTLSPDESFVAVDLTYPALSSSADLSARFHTFRGDRGQIPTRVHYVVDAQTTRTFLVDAGPQRISFSPTVTDVLRRFVDTGIAALRDGAEFLLVAVCLVAVSRQRRTLVVAAGSLLAGQLLATVTVASGVVALTPETTAAISALAASAIAVLAIQTIVSPESRWLPALCVLVGLSSGAARLGTTLLRESAFAGGHGLSAGLALAAAVSVGEIWAIALMSAAAGLLRGRGRLAELAVMSAAIFAGHAALHRVVDQSERLVDAGATTVDRFFIMLTLGWAIAVLCAGIVSTLATTPRHPRRHSASQPQDVPAQ